MHFHAWRSGLKTGQYYFRSRPARDAIKFTVNVDMLLKAADGGNANQVMECLNTENKGNLGRKKSRTAKPASLQTASMRKPLLTKTINVRNVDSPKELINKENGNGTGKAVAMKQMASEKASKIEEDNESSEDDYVCHACSA